MRSRLFSTLYSGIYLTHEYYSVLKPKHKFRNGIISEFIAQGQIPLASMAELLLGVFGQIQGM